MYPINQVILGNDPLLNNLDDLDNQLKKMELYKQKLQQLKEMQDNTTKQSIWNEIDREISPLSDEQKNKLFQNDEYVEVYTKLQSIVQTELLGLVKGKIENTEVGKDLLTKQLEIVRELKSKIVNEESGKCKNISVRTKISKLIMKNKKGKLETYIEVESIINDGDKYNYNKTRIKL